MKKIISLLIVVCVMFNLSSVLAYEVSQHKETRVVYMEGKIDDGEDKFVTLVVKNPESEIVHIGQYETDENGEYSAKFRLKGESADYTYYVKEGSADVNSSVSAIEVTTDASVINFNLINTKNGGKYIDEESAVKAVAQIENKYDDGEEFAFVLGCYNDENQLISSKVSKQQVTNFDTVIAKYGMIDTEIPQGTAYIKGMVWNSVSTIMPIKKYENKLLRNKIFDDEIVVAFFGDSITHLAQHLKFIETYYKTKYPNKKVVFVNKGISGDRADRIAERFYWDGLDDVVSPDFDEAVIMTGSNDVDRGNYPNGTDDNKQSSIDKCIDNIRRVIELCKENNISTTLVTPIIFDEGDYEGASKNENEGVNEGIGKIAQGVRTLAEEYDLFYIDLYEATNSWTNKIRNNENWKNDQVILSADRLHPTLFGGFVMGYEFVKQQGNVSLIAEVEIDARNNTYKAQNALVSNVSVQDGAVAYVYKAKALPVAVTNEYQRAESYGIPVTEDINQEIIRVKGLPEGEYKLSMNGTVLGETYTNTQLSAGVNIATNELNPGQITAKKVYESTVKKITKESTYRDIAFMESVAIRFGFNISDHEDAQNWLNNELDPNFKDFYTSYLESYYSQKPNQKQLWKEITELENDALSLAVTEEITVEITKAE